MRHTELVLICLPATETLRRVQHAGAARGAWPSTSAARAAATGAWRAARGTDAVAHTGRVERAAARARGRFNSWPPRAAGATILWIPA